MAIQATQSKTQPKPQNDPSAATTLVGWQGIFFTLPPEWNVSGFSMDRSDGYLKVDSPGTMFAQIKWHDPNAVRPKSLGGWLFQRFQAWKRRGKTVTEATPPDLRVILDDFLRQTGKQMKRGKGTFDSKLKPETKEANGERTAIHFSWSGGGIGQGKIWHCRMCGRVVIAQIVGQARDNVTDVAAQMFSGMRDHGTNGWETWALYDMVAGVPSDFALKQQKLMSGYLKLDFEKRGGERIVLERWGLANVTRKKFTLPEWFRQTCDLRGHRAKESETTVQEHEAIRAEGHVRNPLAKLKALREALFTWRPATCFEACCWDCPETNKMYTLQVWRNRRTKALLEEVAERCECH